MTDQVPDWVDLDKLIPSEKVAELEVLCARARKLIPVLRALAEDGRALWLGWLEPRLGDFDNIFEMLEEWNPLYGEWRALCYIVAGLADGVTEGHPGPAEIDALLEKYGYRRFFNRG